MPEANGIRRMRILKSYQSQVTWMMKKAIDWLHQAAYFVEHNKSPNEVVREQLKIENEGLIDKKIQIKDNLVEWLCHNTYDNKQWILYLEDEREA